MTCHEVVIFRILIFFGKVYHALQPVGHPGDSGHQWLHLINDFASGEISQYVRVSSVRHITDGSHDLQLSSALVNRSDSGISIQPLAGIFHHETGAAMNLNAVIGILVGIFRIHSLGKRSERIGKTGICLLLLTLLRREGAGHGNVVQSLVYVHVASRLIQQGATSVDLSLHRCQQIVHWRHVDYSLAELLAILGVCQSLVISLLAEANPLSANAQTGTVHERHDVFYET